MTNKTTALKVEGSSEVATVPGTIGIEGLNEVPTNIIPVPFYKLVQPGSTGVTLKDGEDALPGSIFMNDSQDATKELSFALLRAKRMKREFTDIDGQIVHTVSIGVLGVNLSDFSPFILNVPVSSFSSFGALMKQLKGKQATKAWEYEITTSSEKLEMKKQTNKGLQMVKYYVLHFAVADKKLDDQAQGILSDLYKEFAGTLDRNNEQEAEPAKPEQPVDPLPENDNDIPFN